MLKKKSLKIQAAVTAIALSLATGTALAGSDIQNGASAAKGTLPSNISVEGIFGTIANVLIFLVGAISVIVLIVAGLRYVTSGGNPAQVQGAKNQILYAIVGIVVAIAAYAIVQFVFKQLGV